MKKGFRDGSMHSLVQPRYRVYKEIAHRDVVPMKRKRPARNEGERERRNESWRGVVTAGMDRGGPPRALQHINVEFKHTNGHATAPSRHFEAN